jgi:glucose/arabinose dehydrogenase
MTHPRPGPPTRSRLVLVAALGLVLAACQSATPSISPSPGASASASATESPTPAAATLPPLPSGPDALALERVASGFSDPTHITHAGDGSGRLFVVERGGRIRIVNPDGSVSAQPFLDISGRVLTNGLEQGLLGLVFHPEYATNGRFFVNYTRQPDGANLVVEFRVSSDPDVADPATERALIGLADPAPNHNGGGLAFGPDGYLYIALGDGGGQDDQFGNAQNVNSLLGKILRIDVNAPGSAGQAYAIPEGNPFAAGGGAPEIWAIGMRNPWRISFDREWGDLYIADVGGGSWEEINRQPADAPGGLNYGWPIMEGRHCLSTSCTVSGFVEPIAEYGHDQGCSVIGGHVYRGEDQPELYGIYVLGDWCSGLLFTLQVDEGTVTPKVVLESGLQISSIGEDEDGEMYLVDLAGGGLYRIVFPR